MRSVVPACAVAFALGLSGCGRRIFYEWRDEPYLRPCLAGGEAEAFRRTRSVFADERNIGCRVLSVIAREARRAGDEARARRLARALMEHYEKEPDLEVRSTLLAVCLRNAGSGDEDVWRFLRHKLAARDSPASAAYTLASLRAPGSFEAIQALHESTVQTGNFDLRYELLGALWLLGDERAVALYEREIEEAESWPERIHHMTRELYARALRSRLATLKAACAETAGSGAVEPR